MWSKSVKLLPYHPVSRFALDRPRSAWLGAIKRQDLVFSPQWKLFHRCNYSPFAFKVEDCTSMQCVFKFSIIEKAGAFSNERKLTKIFGPLMGALYWCSMLYYFPHSRINDCFHGDILHTSRNDPIVINATDNWSNAQRHCKSDRSILFLDSTHFQLRQLPSSLPFLLPVFLFYSKTPREFGR